MFSTYLFLSFELSLPALQVCQVRALAIIPVFSFLFFFVLVWGTFAGDVL
jgi:hypothetical protein